MFPIPVLAFLLLALGGCGSAPEGAGTAPKAAIKNTSTSKPPPPTAGFDPAADPAKDLEKALKEAKSSGRRVLMKVGGNWCSWCRVLAGVFEDAPTVKQALAEKYVVVRVSVTREQTNQGFLSGFPELKSYPHLYVLDDEGKALVSEDTNSLGDDGNSYDPAKVRAFLDKWAKPASKSAATSASVALSAGFDPAADPKADLVSALAEAQKSVRHVLMKVGGNWCSWCRLMAKFLEEDEEVKAALSRQYVLLRVSVSKDNKNEAFLKDYPKVPGYPHLFVLDGAGKLLVSQGTGELEAGKGYDRAKVLAFLAQWAKK